MRFMFEDCREHFQSKMLASMSRLMVHYMVRKQSMIRNTWEPEQLFHI